MADDINVNDMQTSPVAEAAGGEPAVRVASNEKGRALMATSDIASGSILFQEEPFIYCVNDVCEFKNCNYCLRAIQDQYEGHKMCRECGLSAYCCGDCWRESKHDILECRVFQAMADNDDFGRPSTQIGYATRMLLRMITEFGITNKPILRDFFVLCTNAADISRSDWAVHYKRRCAVIAEGLKYLKEMGYQLETLDAMAQQETGGNMEELLFNMICRIHCNAYGIKNSDSIDCGNALFLQCASINHSCAPNCIITPRMEGIKVRALKDIKPNEEITINYSVIENPVTRRKYLKDNYFFNCVCDTCTKEVEWKQAQQRDVAQAGTDQESSSSGTRDTFTAEYNMQAQPQTAGVDAS